MGHVFEGIRKRKLNFSCAFRIVLAFIFQRSCTEFTSGVCIVGILQNAGILPFFLCFCQPDSRICMLEIRLILEGCDPVWNYCLVAVFLQRLIIVLFDGG